MAVLSSYKYEQKNQKDNRNEEWQGSFHIFIEKLLKRKQQSMHSFWFILHLIHLKPCVNLQCLLKGLRIMLPIRITLYLSVLAV